MSPPAAPGTSILDTPSAASLAAYGCTSDVSAGCSKVGSGNVAQPARTAAREIAAVVEIGIRMIFSFDAWLAIGTRSRERAPHASRSRRGHLFEEVVLCLEARFL